MNWMPSCRRVAELVSQSLDEPLGPVDRLLLRFHLAMCGNCRNVERQLIEVKSLSESLFAGEPDTEASIGRDPRA
jgi:predicted anti-sigma-YlaC factor YlaD